jgi:general secretion pathway protein G
LIATVKKLHYGFFILSSFFINSAHQFFMSTVTVPLTRPIRRRKGFSFIEVMVVIMILGLLVGIVGVSLFDSASQATVDATKTQIRGLETALDLYRLHNGRYPTTDQKLSALLERPEVGIIPKNWNGPYLRSKQLPLDGWDNKFVYTSDGNDYEIMSLGADGMEGGTELDADISSNDER